MKTNKNAKVYTLMARNVLWPKGEHKKVLLRVTSTAQGHNDLNELLIQGCSAINDSNNSPCEYTFISVK